MATQSDPILMLDEIGKVGKVEKEVEISKGLKVTLSTITAIEELEIFRDCRNDDGYSYLTRNKIETLSRAIKAVNGIRFDYEAIEDSVEKEQERQKTVFNLRNKINTWGDEVVTYLYVEWLKIIGDSESYLKKIGIIVNNESQEQLDKLQEEIEGEKNDIDENVEEKEEIGGVNPKKIEE